MIQRTLNRFQSAPNLDIGEGVDRMFQVMKEKNLYEPLYFPPSVRPNSVLLFLFNLRKVEYWDTVINYLDKNYRITNGEARKLTGISDTLKMTRLLKTWVSKGLLDKVGTGFKGSTYYRKPGVEIPQGIPFSRGVENED
jgi:predicted HTH transcriptional regulator